MKSFILEHGMLHQTTCPDTPQQNGVAERKNRTLLEISFALMFESHVPASYWPEAISTANYLTNCLPTKCLQFQTPLATLSNFHPIPSSHTLPPRIFGCVVIGAMILLTINCTPLWTVTSLNTPTFLPSLDLKGRVPVRI